MLSFLIYNIMRSASKNKEATRHVGSPIMFCCCIIGTCRSCWSPRQRDLDYQMNGLLHKFNAPLVTAYQKECLLYRFLHFMF